LPNMNLFNLLVYTTLNLVSLYHDSLLAKAVANLPPSVRKPEPSPHNRYTQFWTTVSPSYKRLALAIAVIQHAEVLFEMGAKKKWGDKGRWRTVIAIEALKYPLPINPILEIAPLTSTGSSVDLVY
jgi:peroxin-16